VETLQKFGFKGSYLSKSWLRQPVFIQSFAPSTLVYIANKTDLPKVLLIDDVDIPTQDTNQVCNPYYLICVTCCRIIELLLFLQVFRTKCFVNGICYTCEVHNLYHNGSYLDLSSICNFCLFRSNTVSILCYSVVFIVYS